MTSLSELLHNAAPRPTRPFDAAAFVETAGQRPRRRILLWIAGLVAGASALLVPNQLGLLTTGSGGQAVETVGPPVTTTTTAAPVPLGDAQTGMPPAAAPTASAPVPVPAVAGDPPSDREPGAADHKTSEDEGCHLSRPPGGGDGPVMSPDSGGDLPECTYTATTEAGYTGSGTWTLEIRRGDETITLDSRRSPACQPVGVIRPGDVVHARLGLRSDPAYASAGSGEWHLSVGPWASC